MLEKGRALDKAATLLIIDGFTAYGWSHSELAKTSGRLPEKLRRYVNISQLALQQRTGEAPTWGNVTEFLDTTITDSSVDEPIVIAEQIDRCYNDDVDFGKHLPPNALATQLILDIRYNGEKTTVAI